MTKLREALLSDMELAQFESAIKRAMDNIERRRLA